MYWNKLTEWFTKSTKAVTGSVRAADAFGYVRAVPAGEPWIRRGAA